MSRATALRSIRTPTSHGSSCADVMKVLADDTRLAVIQLLLVGPQHVHEINAELDIEPTLLSHHLRVLREAGLVVTEREGKSILYRLAPSVRLSQRRRVIDFGCCQIAFNSPAALEKKVKW